MSSSDWFAVPRWRRLALMAALLVLLVIWLASGVLTRQAPQPPEARAPLATLVAVETQEARPVQRRLTLQGDVEPDQVVRVRARTAGPVERWEARLGELVGAGDLLAHVAVDEREAQLRQAEAALRSAQSEYRAAQQLLAEGFVAEGELERREADLEGARAQVEAMRQEVEHTRVRAPIEGVLNARLAEVGDFVAVGGEVAEVVDNDPLVAVVRVPQHAVHRLRAGAAAEVRFVGGGTAEGTLRFVAVRADPATRTFRAEVEIPNPERALPSGISAEVTLLTGEAEAHKVSPAILSLDDAGRVGVRTVDEGQRVRFYPVEIVRAEVDGVWVSGLPRTAHIITVGHGFVSDGEQVRVEPQHAEAGAS
ncbi:efflux RND transporter periplasmic adaptor subunit [Ectothiorhodospiraceae bacterium 2226]|nr:efflux RND transporter periplasmic adaptor subunit [Ectothiorhodospiraceae bacterium 2226]